MTFLNATETSTDPIIYNIVMTTANYEYSQLLPNGTKKIELRCRTPYIIRFSFKPDKVATSTNPHNTLRQNETMWEDDLNLKNITIYLACPSAGKVAELRCWT